MDDQKQEEQNRRAGKPNAMAKVRNTVVFLPYIFSLMLNINLKCQPKFKFKFGIVVVI